MARVKIDVDLDEFAGQLTEALKNSINTLLSEGADDIVEHLIPISRRLITYAAAGNVYLVGKLSAQALAVAEIQRLRANRELWAMLEGIFESFVGLVLGILTPIRAAGGVV